MGIKHLDTVEVFKAALTNAGESLVLVDFYATWCGPCKRIAPWLEQKAKEYPKVKFYKVNVDINKKTTEEQKISCMPTFIFYKEGKKLATIEGADQVELEKLLNKHQ